jgi:hypothetical protein
MKVNGYEFCLELSDNCRTKDLGTVLSMLASEEMEHFNTIAFLEKPTGNCLPAKTKVMENVNLLSDRNREQGEETPQDNNRKIINKRRQLWKTIMQTMKRYGSSVQTRRLQACTRVLPQAGVQGVRAAAGI